MIKSCGNTVVFKMIRRTIRRCEVFKILPGLFLMDCYKVLSVILFLFLHLIDTRERERTTAFKIIESEIKNFHTLN